MAGSASLNRGPGVIRIGGFQPVSLVDFPGRVASVVFFQGCSFRCPWYWIRKNEIDTGKREGLTTAEREEFKRLQKENRELKKANEILRLASAYFAKAELDRQQR